nr:uncharacterized protein LOC119181158 [Rhipicephalus microplus]
MERVTLERLEWIADHLAFFPEQQTGFRRHRCTGDSISDVVATLEDARSSGDVAMLLLLDVESAFDGLPHMAVEAALGRLGINGSLRGFVTAFLSGRTFRVRVGGATSQPRDITAGVPQGSVLSPFLFNMELAGLPASLPTDTRFPARCSVNADDVALWVSATKTEALLIHLLVAARTHVRRLRVGNRSLPWRLVVKYLGLTIDHWLTRIPADKAAATKVRRVQGTISRLQLRGRGCYTKWALRLNQAAASSVLLYAFPLVNLTPARRSLLEGLHRGALRSILGLPKSSPVAATLAEAGEWPLTLRMLQRALGHIDRLHRATDGRALLERLRSQPRSQMGGLCLLYHQMVPDLPVPVTFPPPHHQPPEVHLCLEGATKRRTPAAALQQAASCKLQEQLVGRLQVFTEGSVMPDVNAAAACVIPSRANSRQCRLPFPASSTAVELAGLHLAVDLLAEDIPLEPAAVLCDSKAALQTLANSSRAGVTACLLTAKVQALTDAGVSVSFHWLPSHVGIVGNEKADTLAKAAHCYGGVSLDRRRQQPGNPYSCAVAARDYSQARLKRLLVTVHPDPRLASGRGPKPLPETGLTRRERVSLLRLRTSCMWTAARRYANGLCPSPSCSRCGDPKTLEHLLCACPGLAQERLKAYPAYRRQGLPISTLEHLLFPSRPHPAALRSLAEFVEESRVAAYR